MLDWADEVEGLEDTTLLLLLLMLVMPLVPPSPILPSVSSLLLILISFSHGRSGASRVRLRRVSPFGAFVANINIGIVVWLSTLVVETHLQLLVPPIGSQSAVQQGVEG